MKKKFVLLVLLLLAVGCSTKKEVSKKYELKDDLSNTIVITSDKNVTDKTKVNVIKQDKDYSTLSENINKYVAYDISLSNDEKTIEITSKTKVYLKIPEDFDQEKLIVYYVESDQIEDTFNVQVEKKNDISYAVFETNHFSIYVLAELIEKEEVVIEVEEENKTTTKEESSKDTSSSKDNSSSSTTSGSKTINLVGKWKCADANTYFVFNNNGTGSMYLVESSETVEHTFTWKLSGTKLTVNYAESGLGGGTDDIKIYNENKFDMVPKRNVIYNRFTGEIPMNKTYTKNLSFKTNYINIPSGLEFAYGYSSEETWYVSSTDESLLNKTYTVTYDFSKCSVGSCSVTPKFDSPKGITFLSSVVPHTFELRKIRIFKDIYFTVNYLNFDSSRYNIDIGEKMFMTGVYAESEAEFNNSTYIVEIDMANCSMPGTCTVRANYHIKGGTATLANPQIEDYFQVNVTEK